MPSLSFDPVAHAYDATRGYPPAVAQQIAYAIVETTDATPQTRLLEVGVGTGRIAFPVASSGHNYTGVDISEKMIERLEAKLLNNGWQELVQAWGTLTDEDVTKASQVRRFTRVEPAASMRLLLADTTALPFYDASFDVAIAVHVFHLVDGWQKAVSEIVRVLRPGGLFLHCWDKLVFEDNRDIGRAWERIVNELGGQVKRPGSPSAETDVRAWLQARGLHPQETSVASWETRRTVRQEMEGMRQRLWASTWSVPDDVFAESMKRLEQWINAELGSDWDIERKRTHQFVVSKTQV